MFLVQVVDGRIYRIAGVAGRRGYNGDNKLATSAFLTHAYSVGVDVAGNVYIADEYRLRKIDATTNIITTLYSDIYGARALKFDNAGRLYIAGSMHKNNIHKYYSDGTLLPILSGRQGFDGDGGEAIEAATESPSGIAVHGSSIYFADQTNNRIRRIRPAGS